MNQQFEDIVHVWPLVKDILSVPHSDAEYENRVSFLDDLIDEIGENENHPLASLMEVLGDFIEIYEKRTVPPVHGLPGEVLRYLMNEHGLKQSDLPEIGSQGVVSEVLNEKRSLNIRQVKALSAKFQVSPQVFINSPLDAS